MTTPDYKALCAELAAELRLYKIVHPMHEESLLDRARAALAEEAVGPPRPIPVSERLPGAEDCQDEGWAWYFNPRIGWRQAVLPVSPSFTHWLPAHALPIPENADD